MNGLVVKGTELLCLKLLNAVMGCQSSSVQRLGFLVCMLCVDGHSSNTRVVMHFSGDSV